MDNEQIPKGGFVPVTGTPLDFTKGFSRIGDKERLSGSVDAGGETGLNHGFVIGRADNSLAPRKLKLAAQLRYKQTEMSIYTTQPLLVVYTGNCLP